MLSIGSCRVNNCFKINESYSEFVHTSKEIIQLLNFVENKNINFIDEYLLANRAFKSYKNFQKIINIFESQLLNSNIIILEISSIKLCYYKKGNLYCNYDLYHRVTHPSLGLKRNQLHLKKLYNLEIEKNTIIQKQTENELLTDLDIIYNILVSKYKKKILLVPHINVTIKKNNISTKIDNRDVLCCVLQKFSLSHDNVYYFNPIDYLVDDYTQVFHNNNNGHYSIYAFNIIKKEIHNFINNNIIN